MPKVFITEFVIINTIKNTIENYLTIENKSDLDVNFSVIYNKIFILQYLEDKTIYSIPPNITRRFLVIYNLTTKRMNRSTDYFPLVLSNRIIVRIHNNFGIIFDNHVAKVAGPINLEIESETVKVDVTGKEITFKFNHDVNQYATF